jgi:hypothetical protein
LVRGASHTIIWYGPGAAMNMGTTLAIYATLARETGIPFVFSGSPQSYKGLVDMTDARLLAAHLERERVNHRTPIRPSMWSTAIIFAGSI